MTIQEDHMTIQEDHMTMVLTQVLTHSCPYATCVSTKYFLAFLCVCLRVSAASKLAMARLYLPLLAKLLSGSR